MDTEPFENLLEVIDKLQTTIEEIRYQTWPTHGLGIGLKAENLDSVLVDAALAVRRAKLWRTKLVKKQEERVQIANELRNEMMPSIKDHEQQDLRVNSEFGLKNSIEALKYYGTGDEGFELFCATCQLCYRMSGMGNTTTEMWTLYKWAEKMASESKHWCEEDSLDDVYQYKWGS